MFYEGSNCKPAEKNTVAAVKHSGGSVMLWGFVVSSCIGNRHHMECKIKFIKVRKSCEKMLAMIQTNRTNISQSSQRLCF